MAKNSYKTALIIVGSIIAVTGISWLIWYLVDKKAKADAAAQLKLDKAAKIAAQKAALIKAKTPTKPTTAQQNALDSAMKKAADALKAAQNGGKPSGASSGSGSGSGSGNTPSKPNKDGSTPEKAPASNVDKYGNPKGSTINKEGDYIERDDPTTLYDKSGNVIGDLDADKGIFTDPITGEPIATNRGDKFDTYDKTTDNYSCISDPWNLHSGSGDVIATKDTNSGDYVNPDTGMTLGGTDDNGKFVPYMAVDEQNGEYQERDGQWYNKSGDPIDQPTNPDNISYTDSDQNDASMGIDSRNSDGSIDYSNGWTLGNDGTLYDEHDNVVATNVTDFDPYGDGKITYDGGNSETIIENEVGGTYDPITGNYLDSEGYPVADSDGIPIVAYDDQTGDYQDPSGQWYNSAGEEIDESVVNQENISYNTSDGEPPVYDYGYWD